MEPFVQQTRPSAPALFMLEPWISKGSHITAGFSSKNGGVSSGPYDSLNCAFHVHDRDEDVIQNREDIAKVLHLPFDAWTCGEQVHSNHVFEVKEEHRGLGRKTRASAIQDTDALITNVPGVWLTSFYADCVPLYFWDPIKRAVGLAHAGWKGTVLEIAAKTIEKMGEAYGSMPGDIRTAIGPSIGACCYEVDDHVMQHVNDLAQTFTLSEQDPPIFIAKSNGKFMLDLKQFNRHIMIKAGILPTNIECSTWCTSCQEEDFFSHRRDQGRTGRMISWIAIEKE